MSPEIYNSIIKTYKYTFLRLRYTLRGMISKVDVLQASVFPPLTVSVSEQETLLRVRTALDETEFPYVETIVNFLDSCDFSEIVCPFPRIQIP